MLRCKKIEMLTFENDCSIVFTKIKVDGSILEKHCNSPKELEAYLCDLLTWDGLSLHSSTTIYIKNYGYSRCNSKSDVMLPASWFLEESNVMWLCRYYKETCIVEKLMVIASVITNNLQIEAHAGVE